MIRKISAFIQRHRHVNWALADQAMVSGVNFLTGILLARYLGIEEFGRFTLVWMAVLFVNSIQHAAINSPMMSIGPKQPESEAAVYFGAIMVQQAVFSCTVFFLLFSVVRLSGLIFPEWEVESLAFPLAFVALAYQFQDFLRRYLFTRGRSAEAFAIDAICYLGQIAVLAWLFMSFSGAMDAARVIWVIAIMTATAALCGAFLVERIEINAEALRTIVARHWHFSKWLTGSALMQWTTGNLFIMAAGALMGPSAVGALRATKNLIGVVHILFLGLENIVPVRAARHFHLHGKKALRNYLQRVLLWMLVATGVICLVAVIAPNFWLHLVFGDQYSGYGDLLRWWAVIYLLVSAGLPLSSGLRAIGQSQVIFRASLWLTLVSVLSAYPMTKYGGFTGVMGGMVMVSLLHKTILWFGLNKRLV